jgi:hypothetical protein
MTSTHSFPPLRFSGEAAANSIVVSHVRGEKVCPVLALSMPATSAAAAAKAAAATGQDCDDFTFALLMEGGREFDLGGEDSRLLCSSSSSSSSSSSNSDVCTEVSARAQNLIDFY